MNDTPEIAPAWLEFHDLKISYAIWQEDTITIGFAFGTVYDADMSYYGYRVGVIRFTHATVSGALQTEEDEDIDDPRLWHGSIVVDGKTPAMIPITGVTPSVFGVVTRLVYSDGEAVEVQSRSIEVVITGLYSGTKPSWNSAP